jgi:hypothetical protein
MIGSFFDGYDKAISSKNTEENIEGKKQTKWPIGNNMRDGPTSVA